MGDPGPPPPSMLIVAAFSRHDGALDWARRRAANAWGEPVLDSGRFDFRETDYYRRSMGAGLKKEFWGFAPGFNPARLPEVKLETNAWEAEYADRGGGPEERPLNVDPGYLNLGKLVLASTKDFTHRVYLSRGIYAEVTLSYRHGRWRHHAWTFPDYQRQDYQAFFAECRRYLHDWIRERRTA
ncbi:MAG: DUF4416 family protein [Pirellulaceae bacterium]|jgi:hypothetical protein|nr:DUF4416 family protein [Pirellulaceae bacterium]